MKRFNVTVNGKSYDVAVEEVTGGVPAAPSVAAVPSVQPKAEEKPEEAKEVAAPSASAGEGEKLTAPMPGTILEVKVAVGDTVKKGQPVVVLEAMKMENDIAAPCDGKITSILVSKGVTVNSGDAIATIQ